MIGLALGGEVFDRLIEKMRLFFHNFLLKEKYMYWLKTKSFEVDTDKIFIQANLKWKKPVYETPI